MRQHFCLATALLAGALLIPGGRSSATSANAYQAILGHYEAVRLALVADDLAAARRHAGALTAAVEAAGAEPTAADAAVPADGLDRVRALLPPLRRDAAAVRDASSLEAAREAFYGATAALVRWRALAADGPRLVRCSMAQRVWLQPAGTVGNPYYGRAMARCGEFVPIPGPAR
jgi:hypothetical protein